MRYVIFLNQKTITMKKSSNIILSAAFLAAIATQSCQQRETYRDQWIGGKSSKKDSVVNNHTYRHHNGLWYPVYSGRINPGLYEGYDNSSLRSNNVQPSKISNYASSSSNSTSRTTGVRSGGFGSSSHFSSGS
jgi:hypothetical protein